MQMQNARGVYVLYRALAFHASIPTSLISFAYYIIITASAEFSAIQCKPIAIIVSNVRACENFPIIYTG